MEESGDQSFSRQPITLTTWDVVAIVAYFITILTVGLSVRKINKIPQYHCYIDFFHFRQCGDQIETQSADFSWLEGICGFYQ